MHRAKLQALGTVDRHQPHRVNSPRCRRKLPKVTIVAQSQQPSHALKKAGHRQSGGRRLDADKIQELPNRDPAGTIPDRRRCRNVRGYAGAI